MLTITETGLDRLAGTFAATKVKFPGMANAVVRKAGLNTAKTAKQLAPVRSGTLRRSIHMEMPDLYTAVVGTNLEYARRVEYGFVGADSLGRVYDQAPRAYLGPAFDINAAQFLIDMRQLAAGLA